MTRLIFIFAVQLLFNTWPTQDTFAQKDVAARGSQTEWETTLQAARKEGQVVLYGSHVYGDVFKVFEKRYPEIKVTHVALHGGPTA
jgi:hypothetical protein